MSNNYTFSKPESQQRFRDILALLANNAMNTKDIAKALKIHPNAAWRFTNHMHKTMETIHIEKFSAEGVIGGHQVAYFRAGKGVDAVMQKAPKLTKKERQTAKAKPVDEDGWKVRPAKIIVQRDWLQAAFHGPAISASACAQT